ncbi:MAG: hypothetical protein QXF10_09300 [Ignisphaera sp.]
MGEEKEAKSSLDKHEDIEEVREVLKAVSEFVKEIREPLKDLLNTLLESFSGDRLGREVAAFYKSIVEAGVDPSLAKTLTERFLEERLKPLSSIGNLISGIPKGGEKTKKAVGPAKNSGEKGEE